MENLALSLENIKSLIILDNSLVTGLPLLKALLVKLKTSKKITLIFKYELSNFSDITWDQNMTVNKFFTNKLDSPTEANYLQLPDFPELKYNSNIIIDSLTPLIYSKGLTKTCHYLKKITDKQNNNLFISIIHKDLHEHSHIEALKYNVDLIIDILSSTNETIFNCRLTNITNNKISSTKNSFQITKDFAIKDYVALESKKMHSHAPKIDPASNLTFNLKLKSDEEEARRNLTLPYVATQEKKSTIEYIPDLRDDIDEEDPDEDLDI